MLRSEHITCDMGASIKLRSHQAGVRTDFRTFFSGLGKDSRHRF